MNYQEIKFGGGNGGAGGGAQNNEKSGSGGFGDDMQAFRKDQSEKQNKMLLDYLNKIENINSKRFFEKFNRELQEEIIKNFEYPDVRNTRIYYDLNKASDFALGLEIGGIKNISIIKVEDHWEVRYF